LRKGSRTYRIQLICWVKIDWLASNFNTLLTLLHRWR